MIYTWECDFCNERVEVQRRLAEIDLPPRECDKCGSEPMTRVVVPTPGVKQFILLGDHGWERCEYTKYRSIK